MRYLIKFSYDGTKFHGFQRQNNIRNVQGELEQALTRVLGEDLLIKGAGRTDAGVHALGQCAHFDIDKKVTKKDILEVNAILNGDIKIYYLKQVDDSFHARHSVKEKTYLYKINVGKYDKDKLGYYYQIKDDLDLKKMRAAAKIFVGTHNFQNFVSGKRDDYVSTIFKIKIAKKKDTILIKFIGVGFYRYMVRHLVGSLLASAKGKVTLSELKGMLEHPEIERHLSVVPADGLYLVNIKY